MKVSLRDAAIFMNAVVFTRSWDVVPSFDARASYIHEMREGFFDVYIQHPYYRIPLLRREDAGSRFHRDSHRDFLTFSSRRVTR